MHDRLTRVRGRVEAALVEAGESVRDAWSIASMKLRAARPRSRSRADKPRRLLMIDELVPDPRYGAGYPRARKLLETIVAAGWSVTFYPMIASAEEVAGMRRGGPRGVRFLSSNGRRALARLVRTGVGDFDAVLVSRPATVEAFEAVCAEVPDFLDGTYRIYDAEALFAPREQCRRALFGDPVPPAEYRQSLDRELQLLQGADAITAVSPADVAVFRARTPAEVFLISHKIGVAPGAAGFEDRRDMLFVGRLGGSRELSPNVDSLVWFVDEVMPVLDRLPGPPTG